MAWLHLLLTAYFAPTLRVAGLATMRLWRSQAQPHRLENSSKAPYNQSETTGFRPRSHPAALIHPSVSSTGQPGSQEWGAV